MSTLLVLGGTGFFGKSILDAFKKRLLKDFNISKVIILARNTDQFKIDYPELSFDGVEFINGDIGSMSTLPLADLVVHAASSTNLNDYIDSNVLGGKINIERTVANYCALAPFYHANSKIIYCSSGAVYGKQPLNVEKIDENFNFSKDLTELSIEKQNYCLGKRFAEKEMINLGKLGLNVSIARCFAFYGKYLPKDQHYAYGNFIGSAEKGEKIIINAEGIVFRSFMEADDLVESLIEIALTSNPNCPIFNVGSDKQVSIYELAKNIAVNYGVECEFKKFDDSKIIDRYVPNVDKLKKLLIARV